MSKRIDGGLELVYIAAPYAHENHLVMQLRHEIVNKLCSKIIQEFKCSIFSPISHGHMINTNLDLEFNRREYWMAMDFKILSKCSHMFVLMLDGWEESLEVQEEVKFCILNNIDVRYIDPGKLIGKKDIENIERAIINSETNLDIIQFVIGEWGNETFPNATSETILLHLRDEVKELLEVDSLQPKSIDEVAFKLKECGTEAADVGMLLVHYCHKMKINLGREMVDKFRVNQEREWETEKNEDGYYSHVENNNEDTDYC